MSIASVKFVASFGFGLGWFAAAEKTFEPSEKAALFLGFGFSANWSWSPVGLLELRLARLARFDRPFVFRAIDVLFGNHAVRIRVERGRRGVAVFPNLPRGPLSPAPPALSLTAP